MQCLAPRFAFAPLAIALAFSCSPAFAEDSAKAAEAAEPVIVGNPPADSPFGKLKIGMKYEEVLAIVGKPQANHVAVALFGPAVVVDDPRAPVAVRGETIELFDDLGKQARRYVPRFADGLTFGVRRLNFPATDAENVFLEARILGGSDVQAAE